MEGKLAASEGGGRAAAPKPQCECPDAGLPHPSLWLLLLWCWPLEWALEGLLQALHLADGLLLVCSILPQPTCRAALDAARPTRCTCASVHRCIMAWRRSQCAAAPAHLPLCQCISLKCTLGRAFVLKRSLSLSPLPLLVPAVSRGSILQPRLPGEEAASAAYALGLHMRPTGSALCAAALQVRTWLELLPYPVSTLVAGEALAGGAQRRMHCDGSRACAGGSKLRQL